MVVVVLWRVVVAAFVVVGVVWVFGAGPKPWLVGWRRRVVDVGGAVALVWPLLCEEGVALLAVVDL